MQDTKTYKMQLSSGPREMYTCEYLSKKSSQTTPSLPIPNTTHSLSYYSISVPETLVCTFMLYLPALEHKLSEGRNYCSLPGHIRTIVIEKY